MKTIRIITITGILTLSLCGSVMAQQKQSSHPPMNAEEVVKALDKAINLSEDQKTILKKRAAEIIEKRKSLAKIPKDSTYHSIPFVVDSILTDAQKEIMKKNTQKRCETAINKK